MFYKAHRDVLSVRRAGLIAENKTTSSDYKSELRNWIFRGFFVWLGFFFKKKYGLSAIFVNVSSTLRELLY